MAKQKIIGIGLLVAFVAIAGAYVFLSNPGQPVAQTVADEVEETKVTIDVEAALADRALGDPNAPIVIKEYASLSCGHCANFHKNTFEKLKEAYIDTGKVYFIYGDFPLNTPARDASMIARCLPEDKFFKYIKFLFDTQEDWAYGSNHLKGLRQNAKLLGATDELLNACLTNPKLKEGLALEMQKASTEYQVQSTPSFIINGELARGAHSFESFQKIIDKKLEESSTNQ